MEPKYYIICLDFDGCTDKHYSQIEIIRHITSFYLKHPSIETIYVVIGSLRQSVRLDVVNAQRNSPHHRHQLLSCTTLYDQFLPLLQQEFDKLDVAKTPAIQFCPFLTSDVYNHLPTGTTFQSMKHIFSWNPQTIYGIRENSHEHHVQNQRGESINVLSTSSFKELVDCTKISIIYSQIHYFATHLIDGHILLQFYDDKESILNGLYEFYSASPHFIPSNVELHLIQQIAEKGHKPKPFPTSIDGIYIPKIMGTGTIQPHFHEQIYQLGEHYSWDVINEGELPEPQLFEMLQSTEFTLTHTHTFETYTPPEPGIVRVPTPEPIVQDYPDIIIPEVLSDSIYNTYIALAKNLYDIYCIKRQNAQKEYSRSLELLLSFELYPEIFDLAFEIEMNHRQHQYSTEALQSELEERLEEFEEDAYMIRKDIENYVNFRCNYEEKITFLEYEYQKFKHEKISSLARFLNLGPDEFIQRMDHLRRRYLNLNCFYQPPTVPLVITHPDQLKDVSLNASDGSEAFEKNASNRI